MANALATLWRRLERTINTRQTYKFFMRDWKSLTDLKTCARVVSTMRFSQTLEPLEMPCPRGKHIVVIAPHPDDEMLGAGGALIHARRAGASIRCIYLTSSKPAAQVEAETIDVAAHIGYSTEFLRYPLDRIPVTADSIARLGAALAAEPPDALFLPILFDDHDDHRRANQLLWQAWRSGLVRKGTEVWCYQVYSPVMANVVVDISDVAEEKAAAIRMWKSQIGIRKFDHYILGLNAFNIRLLPKARYVEAFFVVPIDDYAELCAVYFEDPSTAFYNPAYQSGAAADFAAGTASAQ
jgi:LmbE family N-acetylglucosaminyl deacetylase